MYVLARDDKITAGAVMPLKNNIYDEVYRTSILMDGLWDQIHMSILDENSI